MLFRPTSALSKQSSKAWISRQFRDPYVKQRLSDPASYRARSAFKLLEIDAAWDNFLMKPDVNAVVDLGAAPGGWSQVVAGKLGWETEAPRQRTGGYGYGDKSQERLEKWGTWSTPIQPRGAVERAKDFDPLNIDELEQENTSRGRGTIVAVDLLRMEPIHGVHTIQADFLSPEAEIMIHGLLAIKGNPEGKVDVILSDMAANVSGNNTRDTESSLEICNAVFEFAVRHLKSAESIGRKRGGVLLYVSSSVSLLLLYTHSLFPLFSQDKAFYASVIAKIS